ncbi:hypothetical protein [Limnoglobus roseus]|uniref:Uncharacterized protein n=1 Tax=Limnoglobus roseus TaxID=2598579 RepID=A0A5C1A748_9BACT|nr:hypothetical protein [Limnoglobus roseus]QEL14007.1 hypothetical protein PX52LOC_00868 [Limnoglobus roseus]
MATKKKSKGTDDPLGKVYVKAYQPPVDRTKVTYGYVLLGVGALPILIPLLLRGSLGGGSIGLMFCAAGGVLLAMGYRQVETLFEVRKYGVRYVCGRHDFDLEWDEVRHATVRMQTDNPLLSFSGVNDVGIYICRRADNLPFQLHIRGEDGEGITLLSKVLPAGECQRAIEAIESGIGKDRMRYELYGCLKE